MPEHKIVGRKEVLDFLEIGKQTYHVYVREGLFCGMPDEAYRGWMVYDEHNLAGAKLARELVKNGFGIKNIKPLVIKYQDFLLGDPYNRPRYLFVRDKVAAWLKNAKQLADKLAENGSGSIVIDLQALMDEIDVYLFDL